jgi:hypothetical protein
MPHVTLVAAGTEGSSTQGDPAVGKTVCVGVQLGMSTVAPPVRVMLVRSMRTLLPAAVINSAPAHVNVPPAKVHTGHRGSIRLEHSEHHHHKDTNCKAWSTKQARRCESVLCAPVPNV